MNDNKFIVGRENLDFQSLYFKHPMTKNECNDIASEIYSKLLLKYLYFDGTVDLETISLVKAILEYSPEFDDSELEKYILNINSGKVLDEILGTNYKNPDSWHIAYQKKDDSYEVANISQCRMMRSYYQEIKRKYEDKGLSSLELVLAMYDICKLLSFGEGEHLPGIIEQKTANSKGYNLLFQSLLECFQIKSCLIRENSEHDDYLTLVNIDDDKYGCHGFYLFNPSADTLDKSQYSNENIRLLNYNFFGLRLLDIGQFKDSTVDGVLNLLLVSDTEYALERITMYDTNELNGICALFEISYKELFDKISSSKRITLEMIRAMRRQIYSEEVSDDFERVLQENYQIRDSELFYPRDDFEEEIKLSLFA